MKARNIGRPIYGRFKNRYAYNLLYSCFLCRSQYIVCLLYSIGVGRSDENEYINAFNCITHNLFVFKSTLYQFHIFCC